VALIPKALAYNLDAHRANPANLAAGALGMIVNNVIFFMGMWGMLFAGKPTNSAMLPYYVSLNAVVLVSWGALNFFFGGLRWLGELITEGTLEPLLATPRDPLLLAGLSRSSPIALGDLIMGLASFVAIGWALDAGIAGRCVAAAVISMIGFAALFIAAGALSFYVPRGSELSQILIETTISMSVYPTGKMFTGAGRIALLLTPAAATAVLPVEAVETASFRAFFVAAAAAGGFLWAAVRFFRTGLRHYRAVSVIGAR
jgi:ABC-type uncharacterized transport system permease subunit